MNVVEIHGLLLAGKFLEIEFDSAREAETFRVRLHHYKKNFDDGWILAEFIRKEDVKVFSFITDIPAKNASNREQNEFFATGKVTVKLSFREKALRKQFVVRILDDEEATNLHKLEDLREITKTVDASTQSTQGTRDEYERVEYNE